jgi:hypothetical protein
MFPVAVTSATLFVLAIAETDWAAYDRAVELLGGCCAKMNSPESSRTEMPSLENNLIEDSPLLLLRCCVAMVPIWGFSPQLWSFEKGAMTVHKSERNFGPRRLTYMLLLGIILATGAAPAWGDEPHSDEPYSIEPVTLQASGGLPQGLLHSLQPQGTRLFGYSDGVKTAICEIFWVRAIGGQEGSKGASQGFYGRLKQGAAIGVVHFLIVKDYIRDFRSQTIKPGYYTLRYAVMPGGIAENEPHDFVVLIPASDDRDLDHPLPFAELARRSQMAFHSKRPASMSLVEVDNDLKTFPGVVTDDEGTCVLQVKVHVKTGTSSVAREFPLAIVLVTSIPENSGS